MVPHKKFAEKRGAARVVGGIGDRVAYYLKNMAPDRVLTSNFMAMCESLEDLESVRCRACRGSGARELSDAEIQRRERQIAKTKHPVERETIRYNLARESECKKCSGTGHRPASKHRHEEIDSTWTTVRCERCRGCGEVMNEDLEDVCQRCKGDMCVVPITVRKGGSSKKGRLPPGATAMTDSDGNPSPGGVWSSEQIEGAEIRSVHFDEEQVQFRGLLDKVRAASPEAATALDAYHGSDGDTFASHKWGRLFALWPHTQAGARLAQDAAAKGIRGSGFLMRKLDLIASERNAEEVAEVPNMRRRALIGRADKQARGMLERARVALDAAGGLS